MYCLFPYFPYYKFAQVAFNTFKTIPPSLIFDLPIRKT